jgi:cation diffusion facilitator family transporter
MARDIRTIAITISVIVAVLMLAGKCTAFFITGSMAILSDAAESVIHIVATGIAAFSLWYSRQEASKRHPYGHGKVAYFSAGFEGALIMLAAGYIIFVAVRDLIAGPEVQQLGAGLLITGGLGLINLALGVFLVQVGRRRNALILVANGQHVLTDMWTSAGVVAGVGVVWMTGIVWLDPVVAIAMGLNILRSAAGLLGRSLRGLLDAADPRDTQKLLKRLDEAVADGELSDYHQLRHRQSNDIM